MQQKKIPSHQRYKIQVKPPTFKPKITNIGYGNPRYNSMLAYKGNILLPCGSSLRLVNIKNDQILLSKQIGQSQIFQLAQNTKYILVVNFEGLLTFLCKQKLQIKYQFYTVGKQIRHLSFTDHRLVISCELSQLQHMSKLCIYKVSQIEKNIQKPKFIIQGHYYFPQQMQKNNDLIVIEYSDPNPKGRSRVQTVLLQKLPIKHRIVRFVQTLNNIQMKQQILHQIKQSGEIICATSNGDFVYYLHPGRRLTALYNDEGYVVQTVLPGKSVPIMIEKYKDGFIWSSSKNQLTYAKFNKQKKYFDYQKIQINSAGIGGNLSIKVLTDQKGFFLFNQNGLHHYCTIQNKTYSQSQFQITNCGLSMNKDGSLLAVGDFAGNVNILQTHSNNIVPKTIRKTNVGMPIRSLVWCLEKNIIVIGTVGGTLLVWNMQDPEAAFIQQFDKTINILRYAHGKVFLGNSDGEVKILDQKGLHLLYDYKAHHPIHYQTQRQRQLFGSMKNYAQIWSLTISPTYINQQLIIISSSEDQTQKVFRIDSKKQYQMLHHLKGHQLAVTSIDWKVMHKDIGEIYVSCSDDKIIRFRDPKNNFQILFEIQTNTIKQWHTLTYLSLEENGTRVAIGSQNGYLFIYDIKKKQLIFAEKIHLGGVQGLDWKNGKLCTCSSDLCLTIIDFSS